MYFHVLPIIAFDNLKVKFLMNYLGISGGYGIFSRYYFNTVDEKKGISLLSFGFRILKNNFLVFNFSNLFIRILRFLLFLRRFNKMSYRKAFLFSEFSYNTVIDFFCFSKIDKIYDKNFLNICNWVIYERSIFYYSFFGCVMKFINRLKIFSSVALFSQTGFILNLFYSHFFRRFDFFK